MIGLIGQSPDGWEVSLNLPLSSGLITVSQVRNWLEAALDFQGGTKTVNLYLVQWDGGSRYVEAATFGEAVKFWREAMRDEWGEDWSPEDEPDSVARVDDQPVLRA